MADETLLTLSQITEAQLKASTRLYGVIDPAGTPADVFLPMGAFCGGFYKIAPSVASNNLTLALQHLDGTSPSTNNPLGFKIGDDWQIIDAALSFTKNAATNWANLGSTELAAKNVDLFTYLIQETGASAGTKLGWSRIPFAKTMADFNSLSTHEKYIAGSYTNFNSTDKVVNIGRFRAQLSAGAGYTWSIPSALVIPYPIFETDWLSWQPVYSANGSMTYTSVTTDIANYKIRYDALCFELKAHGTTGGVANNQCIASTPFSATNGGQGLPVAAYMNESTNLAAVCYFGTASLGFTKYDNSNWGLGANRYIAGVGQFRIG